MAKGKYYTPGFKEQAMSAARSGSTSGRGPASDDVTLVVSELATNATVHSRSGHGGTFTVRAELHPTWVWIEVEDAGREWTDPGHDDRPPARTHRMGQGRLLSPPQRDCILTLPARLRSCWSRVSWLPYRAAAGPLGKRNAPEPAGIIWADT
jgi:hypothetical protein